MKITKERLKTIIMEELTRAMNEMDGSTGVQAAIKKIEGIIAGYAKDSLEYSNLSPVLVHLRAGEIAKAYKQALHIGDQAVIDVVEPLWVATPLRNFEQ